MCVLIIYTYQVSGQHTLGDVAAPPVAALHTTLDKQHCRPTGHDAAVDQCQPMLGQLGHSV